RLIPPRRSVIVDAQIPAHGPVGPVRIARIDDIGGAIEIAVTPHFRRIGRVVPVANTLHILHLYPHHPVHPGIDIVGGRAIGVGIKYLRLHFHRRHRRQRYRSRRLGRHAPAARVVHEAAAIGGRIPGRRAAHHPQVAFCLHPPDAGVAVDLHRALRIDVGNGRARPGTYTEARRYRAPLHRTRCTLRHACRLVRQRADIPMPPAGHLHRAVGSDQIAVDGVGQTGVAGGLDLLHGETAIAHQHVTVVVHLTEITGRAAHKTDRAGGADDIDAPGRQPTHVHLAVDGDLVAFARVGQHLHRTGDAQPIAKYHHLAAGRRRRPFARTRRTDTIDRLQRTGGRRPRAR